MSIKLPFLKAILSSIIPLIFLMINSSFWVIAKYRSKKNSYLDLMVFTNILILFFMQPSVLKSLINPLKCSKIDNNWFITSNMMISCDDDTYSLWVKVLFLSLKLNFLSRKIISLFHWFYFGHLSFLFSACCAS